MRVPDRWSPSPSKSRESPPSAFRTHGTTAISKFEVPLGGPGGRGKLFNPYQIYRTFRLRSRNSCRGFSDSLTSIGMALARLACMLEPRIVPLADGEELISFEVERARPLVDDPRQELLEHRRAAQAASERAAIGLSDAGDTDTSALWHEAPRALPMARATRPTRPWFFAPPTKPRRFQRIRWGMMSRKPTVAASLAGVVLGDDALTPRSPSVAPAPAITPQGR